MKPHHALITLTLLACAGCAGGPITRAEAETRLTQIAYEAQATATAQAANAEARITQVALQSLSAANAATEAAALREMAAVTATLQALPYDLKKKQLTNEQQAEALRQERQRFDALLLVCGGGSTLAILVLVIAVGVNLFYYLRDRRLYHRQMLNIDLQVETLARLPAPEPPTSAPEQSLSHEQQWRAALAKACAWAARIGWGEKAWKDYAVVYYPANQKHNDEGRRLLMKTLDEAGVTVQAARAREWALGWSATTWERLLPHLSLPHWPEVEPPAMKIPVRNPEEVRNPDIPILDDELVTA